MTRKLFTTIIVFSLISILLILGPGTSLTSEYERWFVLGSTKMVNNRHNYANHDFCSDMLKTTELETILMTQGEDNQVFGLLYFSLAKNVRPDIDFFDQQGNVFPRLYGDFIGYHPEEVRLIRAIRDFQLFSTGRPVYMTWKRKEINLIHPQGISMIKMNALNKITKNLLKGKSIEEKLHWSEVFRKINMNYRVNNLHSIDNTARTMISSKIFSGKLRSGDYLYTQDFRELGPWYLKPIGLLYRVTPLRYAVVDGLAKMGGVGSIYSLIKYLNQKLKLTPKINKDSFSLLLEKLEKEEYIEVSKTNIHLLKPFTLAVEPLSSDQRMLDFDYWNHYSFNFLKREEATEWDMLSRQIFSKYFTLKKEMLERASKQLRNLGAYEKNKQKSKDIVKKANLLSQQAFDLERKKINFSKDNPHKLVEIAQLYEEKGFLEKASILFILAADTDISFAWGYLRAAKILMEEQLLKKLNKKEKIKNLKKSIALFSRHQKRKKMQMIFQQNYVQDNEELQESRQKMTKAYKLLEEVDKEK